MTVQPGSGVMETKVDGSALDERYQQGGLMAYAGDDDYVKLDYLTTNTAGSALQRSIELRSEIGGAVQNPQPNASPAPTQGVWHLRLTKSGDDYTGVGFVSDDRTCHPPSCLHHF